MDRRRANGAGPFCWHHAAADGAAHRLQKNARAALERGCVKRHYQWQQLIRAPLARMPL
jgi:hypothetical protein